MAKKKKRSKKKAQKKVTKKKTTKKKAKKKKAAADVWTAKEANLLRKLFATNPTAKIAPKFGRSTDAVKKKAARMGLRKSKRYMKTLGR